MYPPTSIVFFIVPGALVTDAQLKACASLFSSNYGVWSSPVPRVKMGAARLRDQCLSDPTHSMLALCTIGKALYHNQASRSFTYYNLRSDICWITQLVGSRDYRERGIATSLLQLLPGPDFKCGAFGLATSHPAACLALFKRTCTFRTSLDLDFIKTHAQKIINTTNISYLKDVQLRGSLLQDAAEAGVVSFVFTAFYVDYEEPLQALKSWEDRQDMTWPLGVLTKGHEFFCIAPLDTSRSRN
ncbi:hypothetical protein B0H17DRAFT_1012938 [Mycena rosella]|uniref:N-acetyltransferase domain-containing protein n=1 Tax=Mycena rosella TaxID=1033263 RepID=A0AAD7DD72_MYCRO|nr:hypothetical protein B0H17DRAFT_1012938 [Mycena rosella]